MSCIKELKELDGEPSWIIGRVVANHGRKVRVMEDVEILEVGLK